MAAVDVLDTVDGGSRFQNRGATVSKRDWRPFGDRFASWWKLSCSPQCVDVHRTRIVTISLLTVNVLAALIGAVGEAAMFVRQRIFFHT
jgi:hypothetical protein